MLLAYRERRIDYDAVLRDGAGEAISPGASDQVRVRISRLGTDLLTFSSNSASAAGSTVTKGNPTKICLVAADLEITAGTYTLAIDFYDAADAEWRLIEKFVLHLEDN